LFGLDNIIRKNSDGVPAATSSTPVTVSLAGGESTDDGSTLVVFLGSGNGQGFSVTPPSGWIHIQGIIAVAAGLRMFRRGPAEGLVAGESSWNFSPAYAPAGPVWWTVLEIPGVDPVTPQDADSGGFVTVASSGTTAGVQTGLTSTYDGLGLSVHVSWNPGGTDSWGSHTDGFTEVAEGAQSDGTGAVDVSVSARPVQQIGQFGATATCSRTLTTAGPALTYSFVLNAVGARKAANVYFLDGAEHGTAVGNTLGVSGRKIIETITGNVSISSLAACSGNYGWLLSSTAAACNVTFAATSRAGLSLAHRRRFRFRPSLPSVDVEFWRHGNMAIRFIAATGKLGLQVGTGTEQVSDQVITANQWFAPEFVKQSSSVYDWSVDYNAEPTDTTGPVAQAQASGTGGDSSIAHRFGWPNAITVDMDTDDGIGAAERASYPFGNIQVLPLKVDPAATPTVSGSTANFGVMNGGVVTAWNATNARNAVDDVPPDLSATRDAAVAVTAHATDYVEFPMETLDAAALGVSIRGIRFIACIWAASATAATIRFTMTNGVETFTYGDSDYNQDNTATPVWFCDTMRPISAGRMDWTQAKLDATVFRFGSNDATPDIGVDMVLAEVAVRVAEVVTLIRAGAADEFLVQAAQDPDSSGYVALLFTVPADRGADFSWEYPAGTPNTKRLDAGDPAWTEPIGAADITAVPRVTIAPDPVPA
jgi:hypothetical protein